MNFFDQKNINYCFSSFRNNSHNVQILTYQNRQEYRQQSSSMILLINRGIQLHFITMTFFFFHIAHSQRSLGCLRYEVLDNKILRCAQCYPKYVLSHQFLCISCANHLVHGKCLSGPPNTSNSFTPINAGIHNEKESAGSYTKSISTLQSRPNVEINGQASFSPIFAGQNASSFSSTFSKTIPKNNQNESNSERPLVFKDNCLRELLQRQGCQICEPGYELDPMKICKMNNRNIFDGCYVFSFKKQECLKCELKFKRNEEGFCLSEQNFSQEQLQKATYEKIRRQFNKQVIPEANNEKQTKQRDLLSDQSNRISSDFSSFGGKQEQPEDNDPIAVNSIEKDNQKHQKSKDSPSSITKTPSPTNIIHKYPDFPFCFDYFDGQCWACIPGYVLNLIVNKCFKSEPALSILDLFKPKSTTFDQNCNISRGEICVECFRNYYFNKKENRCQIVNALCRTFDHESGRCETCYEKYQFSKGECILK